MSYIFKKGIFLKEKIWSCVERVEGKLERGVGGRYELDILYICIMFLKDKF